MWSETRWQRLTGIYRVPRTSRPALFDKMWYVMDMSGLEVPAEDNKVLARCRPTRYPTSIPAPSSEVLGRSIEHRWCRLAVERARDEAQARVKKVAKCRFEAVEKVADCWRPNSSQVALGCTSAVDMHGVHHSTSTKPQQPSNEVVAQERRDESWLRLRWSGVDGRDCGKAWITRASASEARAVGES